MIIDQLQNLKNYAGMHPRFPEAFAFFEELLEQAAADGRYDMPGIEPEKAIYVILGTNEPEPQETANAESHDNYIDVQILLEGDEVMYVPMSAPAVSTPYQPSKDCTLYAPAAFDDCSRLLIKAGQFALFFTGELHAPCHRPAGLPCTVRKAIIKVLN